MCYIYHIVCTSIGKRTCLVYNFNCHFENGLPKVTAGHVHCKCGNNLKTVKDRDVGSTDHYRK